jgi:hypothetical protein
MGGRLWLPDNELVSLYSRPVMALTRLVAILFTALLVLSACGNQGDSAQIRAVIEKADHEQEDAFAARDASLMMDTNTAKNFVEMSNNNEEFASQGIVGIRLTKLEWGEVNVTSPTTATATNWETWEQTDVDGNTQSSREHEVYTLLKVGDSWKIDNIAYPDHPAPSASAAASPSASATP